MPFTEQLVRRFTTGDRWFSSLLGPTFPNRQYLYAAQSGGQKKPRPARSRARPHPDDLGQPPDAKVPSAYYYTDLPILTLWGDRFYDVTHSLDRYFEDAQQGKLARS